jgi:hypothetical protein
MYAMHIFQENREYGPLGKTMEILKVANKEKYLDIWEIFYIYCIYWTFVCMYLTYVLLDSPMVT